MYHVSAQGVDERMINVHYYYYFLPPSFASMVGWVMSRRSSTVGSHAFSVFSPSTWNDLPLPVQQKPSLDSFKCNLKIFLFPKLYTRHVSVSC